MRFEFTPADYMDYILAAAAKIDREEATVTEADAATGDGDHWINIHMGFSKLIENESELRNMSFSDMFKRIGMLLMSGVGGSSGVLYGSAYIAASKVCCGVETLSPEKLCEVLGVMCNAIMQRGQTQPGYKTMVDAIHPAVETFSSGLASGTDLFQVFRSVADASIEGAEKTKEMEAVKGRASYQLNKGIGCIDPGALTMSYQISTLMEAALNKLQKNS